MWHYITIHVLLPITPYTTAAATVQHYIGMYLNVCTERLPGRGGRAVLWYYMIYMTKSFGNCNLIFRYPTDKSIDLRADDVSHRPVRQRWTDDLQHNPITRTHHNVTMARRRPCLARYRVFCTQIYIISLYARAHHTFLYRYTYLCTRMEIAGYRQACCRYLRVTLL